MAAHCESCAASCSRTIRTARVRTSGENRLGLVMAPSSQDLEPPGKPGRFKLVTNGGFESNGGANSNSFTGWTVTDQVGGSGSFFAQTGTSKPTGFSCSTFPTASVPNPPQGTFAAMTVQSERGSHILSQDVSIPVGATVQFNAVVYQNSDAPFATPASLDYLVSPNQQARIDI